MERCVIIGAGFAGLEAAKALAGQSVQVTILDRTNHHLFQPLLYQVATAGLSPADISYPIRAVVSGDDNIEVVLAEVVDIDRQKQRVVTSGGTEYSYDYLIVATGVRHSYFGKKEWERFAPGLKTLVDAIAIRQRILLAFEEAEKETDRDRQKELLTFVVVGGGPTGIEMAGAIAELAKFALAKDFRRISPRLASVILIEAGERILQAMHPRLASSAMHDLSRLGVKIRLNERVTDITADTVTTNEGAVKARCVVWAAGVEASPLAAQLKTNYDRSGRVLVTPELTLSGDDRVYVIGDLAAVPWRDTTVPGMAPGAMQEGRYAGRAIAKRLRQKHVEPFRYFHKGSMATIGRASAVVEAGKIRFSGFVAWIAWVFVHIFYLIGFRNRMLVMLQWFWNYMTFQRGSRLITSAQKTNPLEP